MGGARFGMHRSEDIAPFVPGAAMGGRTLADGCPDPAVRRFQAEAPFILEAQPHPLIRLGLMQFAQRLEGFFGRRLGPQDLLPEDAAGAAPEPIGAGASRCANP